MRILDEKHCKLSGFPIPAALTCLLDLSYGSDVGECWALDSAV